MKKLYCLLVAIIMMGSCVFGVDFNIRDYGAKGDGVTDDRNAIAMTFYQAAQINGTVVIPPGDYKLVADLPITVGKCNVRGEGGKIWVSLPDGYVKSVNTNDDLYIATNRFDSATGIYKNWTNIVDCNFKAYLGVMSWNGKGLTFINIGSSAWVDRFNTNIIENFIIDGGWGTTNAPAGVHPIFGLTEAGHETQYYQTMATSYRVIYKNCKFINCPGSSMMGGFDKVVDGCYFEEFGDHGMYEANRPNILVTNSTFIIKRNPVLTPGNPNYIGQSVNPIKFVNSTNVQVINNTFVDSTTTPISGFVHFHALDVYSYVHYNMENALVSGNDVSGAFSFAWLWNDRTGGPYDYQGTNGGYRLRNIVFEKNKARIRLGRTFYSQYLTCDGIIIRNNQFDHDQYSQLIRIHGGKYAKETLKNFLVENNSIYFDNANSGGKIFLGGVIDDFILKGNVIYNRDAQHTTAAVLIRPFSNLTEDQNNVPSWIKSLKIQDNIIYNFYIMFLDGSASLWKSGNAYPFETKSLVDGDYVIPRITRYGNYLYTNRVAIASSTVAPPNSSDWGLYINDRPLGWFSVIGNTRVSNSTNVLSVYNFFVRDNQTSFYKMRQRINMVNYNNTNIYNGVRYIHR